MKAGWWRSARGSAESALAAPARPVAFWNRENWEILPTDYSNSLRVEISDLHKVFEKTKSGPRKGGVSSLLFFFETHINRLKKATLYPAEVCRT